MISKHLFFIIIFSTLFLISCTTEPIIKYQCQNGQVVDSIELCKNQECPKKTCEIIKEPYIENSSYKYTYNYAIVSDETLGVFLSTEPEFNWGTRQETRVKNFEDNGGDFTIQHHYRTLNNEKTEEITLYIKGGETTEFNTTYDNNFGEDIEVTTEVIPPSETRYSVELKYNEVERCDCN